MNSLLSRYEAGEHEAVWADLHALGSAVRNPAHFDDASAVAHETMRRARSNIERIIERLDGIGYSFWDGIQGPRRAPPRKLSFGDRELEAADLPSLLRAMLDHARSIPVDALTSVMIEQLHNIYRMAVWPWQDTKRLMRGDRHHADAATVALFEQAKKTQPNVVAATMLDELDRLAGAAIIEMKAAWKAREGDASNAPLAVDHRNDKRVLTPPRKKDAALLRRLGKAGIELPLSLAAWIEEVGGVNLCGAHPALCFWENGTLPVVHADPLMISVDLAELDTYFSEPPEGPIDIVVGWDARSKARLTVEDIELDFGYTVALPQPAADGPLKEVPGQPLFVDYLRRAFAWGGFSGWAGRSDYPAAEIDMLRADLLPI